MNPFRQFHVIANKINFIDAKVVFQEINPSAPISY